MRLSRAGSKISFSGRLRICDVSFDSQLMPTCSMFLQASERSGTLHENVIYTLTRSPPARGGGTRACSAGAGWVQAVMKGCLVVLLGRGCMGFGMAWLVHLLEADLVPRSQHDSLCCKARPAPNPMHPKPTTADGLGWG